MRTTGARFFPKPVKVKKLLTLLSVRHSDEAFLFVDIQVMLDPHVMSRARTGIPVTVQRRFDVYKDVAEELGKKC